MSRVMLVEDDENLGVSLKSTLKMKVIVSLWQGA